MYCRECGNTLPENAVTCPNCGTKKNEGANYCQNCGFHTTAKTGYCLSCGAKQKTIIPQKVKDDHKAALQKQLKLQQTFLKIDKTIAMLGIIVAVTLFVFLAVRPAPDNIPDISEHGRELMFRIGDTYYYESWNISKEVAEYWAQGRSLLMYIILSLFMSVSSFIGFIVQKHICKKIRKKIKEVQ